MSFCPTKDIHSIYLDNEMPELYKAEYEAHIANCSKCKNELEQLRVIRSVFQEDTQSISLDAHFMDESFARLQTKLSYSKNVAKSEKPKIGNFTYALSGIAVAAVFALIVPLSFGKSEIQNLHVTSPSIASSLASPSSITMPSNVTSILPITVTTNVSTANKIAFNSGKNELISSKIHERVLPPNPNGNIQSAIVQNVKSVDFLRPNFGDDLISIRITVPGMSESPVVTEIILPSEIVSGRF